MSKMNSIGVAISSEMAKNPAGIAENSDRGKSTMRKQQAC